MYASLNFIIDREHYTAHYRGDPFINRLHRCSSDLRWRCSLKDIEQECHYAYVACLSRQFAGNVSHLNCAGLDYFGIDPPQMEGRPYL